MTAAKARTLLAALCLLCLPLTALSDPGDASIDAQASERQVLVMLRMPPPHFRPDANYLGSYDTQMGRNARKRVAEGLATQFRLRIVDSWPVPSLGIDCFVMEASTDASMGQLIEDVGRDKRVEWIQGMNLFHSLSQDDPLFPLQPAAKAWHLGELHSIATGKNVRIAEIDSGVEIDHPDLLGGIALSRNFVDRKIDSAETHGTAVAGIIAARAGNGVGIVGVAPQAELMALRACWQPSADGNHAVCSSFTLAKAIQFAIDKNARIINLSLSGPRDRLLENLLDVAMSRKIVVVAAADPARPDWGFPATMPGVIAVAADDAQDTSAAIFLAPGRDIPTTLPGRRWGFVGGSSFAAAEVSGLVALLVELDPERTALQIRETLATSDETPLSRGRRAIVDACAAVARTVGACACGCSLARGATSPAPLH